MNRKIIVPLLLASLTGGVVATTTNKQVFNVYADQDVTNLVGNTIELTGFTNTGKVGEAIALPNYRLLDQNGSLVNDDVTVTVTDPNNRVLTEVQPNGSFTPTITGTYTVVYSTEKNDTIQTVSQALKIVVTGETYSISVPQNSEYSIPSTIPTSTTNPLLIPVPTVTDASGDEVEAETSDAKGLRVYVVARNGSGSDQALTLVDGKYYSWMPTDAGVYEIVYKYVDGNVRDTKTQRFVVKSAADYNVSDIELQFAYEGSIPTTAVMGVETTLPTIKVTDKNSGNTIESYTKITVAHVGTGNVYEVKDFKFTPTLSGEYRVTYQAVNNYFGKSSPSHTFIITNVKDNVAPVLSVVNNYEYDQDTNEIVKVTDISNTVVYDRDNHEGKTAEERLELATEALSDLRHAVPSVVVLESTGEGAQKSKTISIPAAYATDNVSEVSDVTFTRIVRDSSTSVQVPITADFNKAATHTFTKAGNYTIRYVVRDKAGNEKTTVFDVKVVNNIDELKDPKTTVNLTGIAQFAYEGSKITFATPTATDNHDSRLELNTFYRFDSDAADVRRELKADSNGKMTIELTGLPAAAENVIVYAEAVTDYGTSKTATATVRIVRIDDQDAPTFEVGDIMAKLADANEDTLGIGAVITADGNLQSTGKAPFDQTENNVIKLPSLNITDASDPNLEISVIVRNPNGSITSIRNSRVTSQTVLGENVYTISGGEFTAVYAGTYQVTYTARDAGGNISVKTFGVKVADTQSPSLIFTNEEFFTQTYQLGQFVKVPPAGLMDNGQIITDLASERIETTPGSGEYKPGVRWEVKQGPSYTTKGILGFTPLAEGSYTIVYTGWDNSGIETISREFTITIADTIKPTVTLETEYTLPSAVDFDENATNIIKLPSVNLFDGVRNSENSEDDYEQTERADISLVVKVTDSSGNEITVSQLEEVSLGSTVTRYTFEASKQNVYTYRYTATDASGNVSELVRTVEVGDVQAPTLTWDSEYNIPTNVDLNSSFELDLSKATIVDDSEETIVPTVVMTAPDGKTVQSIVTDQYKWKFEQTGSYTLTITVKDDANNSTPYTYTITVTEKEANKQVISDWLGTAIIVVSVVILAGVIGYFFITGRGMKDDKAKTSKKRRVTKK